MMAQPPDTASSIPVARFEPRELDNGVHVVFKLFGNVLRIAYDPAQTTREKAGALVAIYLRNGR